MVNAASVSEVVRELDRHALRAKERRAVLHVKVDVGLGCVPRVAAPAEQLPRAHTITDLHRDRAVSEVGDQGVLAVAQVEDDVVAGGMLRVHVAGTLSGSPSTASITRAGAGARIRRPNAQ